VIPCSPSAPIFGQRSRGKRLSRSIAAARGAISLSQKVLALSRIISALSPRSKSNGLGALGIMGGGDRGRLKPRELGRIRRRCPELAARFAPRSGRSEWAWRMGPTR
jgi:hypothetical protein